jgi:hypothetical protein
MSANFFESPCKEPSRTDPLFGICDDQNGRKAYSDLVTESKWIATVKNEQFIEVTFTSIDNCITFMKEGTKDKESTCDGMLTFQNSLYLVELKKRGTGGWLHEAIGQLENTIKLLYANYDLSDYKYKKAYACNKKHPSFTALDNEISKRFLKQQMDFVLMLKLK